ncbi:MAG: HAMP domain-containing sensor histidine kinase [Paracoccaceae bacterium]|nr:HAMP domain-containing sensor histidine kinase [Paracoccaceae bacterium]
METITGIPSLSAIGRTPGELFGDPAEVLETTETEQKLQVGGLGALVLRFQDDLCVATVADHEREAFLGMAAHDLRAPLRNILFLADEAACDAYNNQAYLAKMKQVARQAIVLTNDVLACAQASGVAATTSTKIALRPLAEAIFATISAEVGHQLCASDAVIMAERPVVQIVLQNLISNAIRHSGHRATRIHIGVEDAPTGLAFDVSDDGAGFPSPSHAFLSGGEFRVESGYGLLAVRRLIRSRGGQIGLAPSNGAPGSTVRFTLPGHVLRQERIAAAS